MIVPREVKYWLLLWTMRDPWDVRVRIVPAIEPPDLLDGEKLVASFAAFVSAASRAKTELESRGLW